MSKARVLLLNIGLSSVAVAIAAAALRLDRFWPFRLPGAGTVVS